MRPQKVSREIPRSLWAGGMVPKRAGPSERRGKSAERSEEKETSKIPDWRDGTEKSRSLEHKREERREKREESEKPDQDKNGWMAPQRVSP